MPKKAVLLLLLAALCWVRSSIGAKASRPSTRCCGAAGEAGPKVSTPRDACIPDGLRDYLLRRVKAFEARRPAADVTASAVPIPFPFYPLAGNLGQEVWINNYVDLDPTQGTVQTWDCRQFTYDGHGGHDSDHGMRICQIKGIGLPIFAALDGTVVEAHDGEDDRHGCEIPFDDGNPPVNYVILHHGGTQYTWYFHLKTGSVAVTPGQTVKAGQQLGLMGSSGRSTWPHLHFQSMIDGAPYEPFAGGCRAGASNWVSQPALPAEPHIFDAQVVDDTNAIRGTWLTGVRPVVLQFSIATLAPGSSTTFRYRRPDGSQAATGTFTWDNTTTYNISFWRLGWNVDLNVAGQWTLETTINGQPSGTFPFTVVASAGQIANRAPYTVVAELDPARPTPNGAIFCRVRDPYLARDPDYDLVRYHYVWRRNLTVIRDVVSAGMADALPTGAVSYGDVLSCSITPSDGTLSGSPTVVQRTIGWDLSGRVTLTPGGAGLAGATVVAGARSTTTAMDGTYSFSGLAPGSQTITVQHPGYVFTPAFRTVNLTSDQTGIDFTAGSAYRISGRVTLSGNGLGSVTIAAGGQTALTAADGTYTLTGLGAGTYPVTPTRAEHSFAPVSRTVTIGPDQSGVDFTATVNTYTISGRITVNGVGLAGVAVAAGGQTAVTDATGAYTMAGLTAGSYVVTPSHAEYVFSPASRNATVGPNQTGLGFTATVRTYSVSGTVTQGGVGVAGVTLTAGGKSAVTNTGGSYLVSGLAAGTYTLTPSKPELVFTPGSRAITVGPDLTGANFTAEAQTYTLSGRVTLNGNGLEGVTVTADNRPVLTAPDGSYAISGLVAGTYSVTPAKSGFRFSPASRSVSVGPNTTTVDFAAEALFTIEGTVTYNGSGLAGVTVTAGGQSVTTSGTGTYAIGSLPAGSYTVEASRAEYRFSPPTQVVTVGPSRTSIDFTAEVVTYVISGEVRVEGQPLVGVTLSAGGKSAVTLANGTYAFPGLPAGSYTVTATRAEYLFQPASQMVTLGPDRSGVNFTGTLTTYSASGRVTLGGSPFGGVTVTLGNRSVVTGLDGRYQFSGVTAGPVTVMPALAGYGFSPPSHNVTFGPSRADLDFAAQRVYTISGRITEGEAALPGVTVRAGSLVATTGADGSYALTASLPGSYSVQPEKPGYFFNPPFRTVQISSTNVTNVDFSGSNGYEVRGTVSIGTRRVAGVTLRAGERTATTGSDGTYVISGLSPGAVTVIAEKEGYAFSPASRTLTITSNTTGVDFTATEVPYLTGLTLSVNTVKGKKSVKGTVLLGRAPTATTTITLESSNPAVVIVPPKGAKVAKKKTSGKFQLKTKTVTSPVQVTITARLGSSTRHVTLTVTP